VRTHPANAKIKYRGRGVCGQIFRGVKRSGKLLYLVKPQMHLFANVTHSDFDGASAIFSPDDMAKTRDEILEHRRRLKAEYGRLFDSIAALLYKHDPIGISFDFDENCDEYEPEAGTILPKLHGCRSEADVLKVVHAEFVRWFDSGTAGPQEHYKKIASEIWQLWQEHLAGGPTPD
jgi:hypothetical protein